MTDDVTPSNLDAIEALLDRMRDMEADFAEERTRAAADAALAAYAPQETAQEVRLTFDSARDRLTKLRRKIVLGMVFTFLASTVTAYFAVAFHEVVRNGCYTIVALPDGPHQVRRQDPPNYCGIFPWTGPDAVPALHQH